MADIGDIAVTVLQEDFLANKDIYLINKEDELWFLNHE